MFGLWLFGRFSPPLTVVRGQRAKCWSRKLKFVILITHVARYFSFQVVGLHMFVYSSTFVKFRFYTQGVSHVYSNILCIKVKKVLYILSCSRAQR